MLDDSWGPRSLSSFPPDSAGNTDCIVAEVGVDGKGKGNDVLKGDRGKNWGNYSRQVRSVQSASEVPEAVKNAFTAKYSTATDVIWENAHEGDIATYKVKFKNNAKDMKAEFKEDGSLIKENLDE